MAADAIRRVWGPRVTEEYRMPNQPGPYEIRWFMWGVRTSGKISRWHLIFDPRKREYRAAATPASSSPKIARRLGLSEDPGCLVELRDAMLPYPLRDHPIMDGRVVDILRDHLRPSDRGDAMRAVLAWGSIDPSTIIKKPPPRKR